MPTTSKVVILNCHRSKRDRDIVQCIKKCLGADGDIIISQGRILISSEKATGPKPGRKKAARRA